MTRLYLLGGRARVGKDSFAKILADIIYAVDKSVLRSYAFASELKRELDPYLTAKYHISAFTVNDTDKLVIRPELVKRGAEARAADPDHWIKLVDPQVKQSLADGLTVSVNDCRYANEAAWGQALGGKVVYIKRIREDGTPVPCANLEEEQNDSQVEAMADIRLTWPTLPLDKLRPYAQDIWNSLNS